MGAGLRIVFLGTAELAVPILRVLAREGPDEIVGVFTRPDRPAGRGQRLHAPPVKAAAQGLGLPLFQPERVSVGEGLSQLASLAPDLLVVAAFGEILRESVLTLPRLGAMNLHASLLPKYRGAAPIQRALMAGETVTGVTAQWMVKELDAGDILLQRALAIGPCEDHGSLHDRLVGLAAEMAPAAVDLIRRGEGPRLPQDGTQTTYAPPITKEELWLEWERPAAALFGLVRGLAPRPGARTTHLGRSVKVLAACLVKNSGARRGVAGEVVETGKRGFEVATGEGELLVVRVQPEGRTPMAAADYALGYRLQRGQRLGSEGR